MKLKESKSKQSETNAGDNSLPNADPGVQRRKILGWIGVGIVGSMAFKVLPLKLISGRGGRRKSVKPDARVAINGMAVKRGKKVSKNV
jgi:hypothetical protein